MNMMLHVLANVFVCLVLSVWWLFGDIQFAADVYKDSSFSIRNVNSINYTCNNSLRTVSQHITFM